MAYLTYYCTCGYPIALVGHGSGDEYALTMHDGRIADPRNSQPLPACPACRVVLQMRNLRFLPTHRLQPQPQRAPIAQPQQPPAASATMDGTTGHVNEERDPRAAISEQQTHLLKLPSPQPRGRPPTK